MASPRTAHPLGSILSIWAHPDDEAYLAAGPMTEAVDEGCHVTVVSLTAGEAGSADEAPRAVAARRAAEHDAAMAALGVTDVRRFGFPDGGCAGIEPARGVAVVDDLLAELRPDTILTFGPDGITGHRDHVATSAWVTEAWHRRGRRERLLYAAQTPAFLDRWEDLHAELGVDEPGFEPPATPAADLALEHRLTEAGLDRKVAALQAHRSQTAGLIEHIGIATYREWVAGEWFVAPERHPWRPARPLSPVPTGGRPSCRP